MSDVIRSMLVYHRTNQTPPQSLYEALWNECCRLHGSYTDEAHLAYDTALWVIKAAA